MATRLLTCLFASLALCGCHISRSQVNPHIRDIDTSWIRPGETTRRQVIDRIGLPPTAKDIGGVTADSFRWSLHDRRTGTLEIGRIVTPTFELSHAHFAEDILVKFDKDGKVCLLSRTASDGKQTRIIEWKAARK
jgi:hypothetical protein